MVSRSEELTPDIEGPSSWHLFLEQRLMALLPKEVAPAAPALAHSSFAFYDGPRVDGPESTLETPAEAAATVGEAPVILWHLHPKNAMGFSATALPRLRRRLQHWHRQLPNAAYLLVAVPEDEANPARQRGAEVSSHRPSAVRQAILLLSEHGFAVRKEASVGPKAYEAWVTSRDLTSRDLTSPDPVAPDPGAQNQAPSDPPTKPWHLICSRRDPFHIRPYVEGDEAAILELFPTCFHVPRSAEHWRWKYRQNPFGETAISLALSDRDRLAAHYAGYAMPFYYSLGRGCRRFPALQMGDTMTNPLFRQLSGGRNGLLGRTVKHFFALHRGGPYGFFYGFNTGPIQRFCRWFIGGSRVEPVGFWRYTEGRPAGPWSTTGYQVEPLLRAGDEVDRLFRQAAPHYGFLVQRDARYLSWRYFGCPDTEYLVLAIRRWRRLVGWGVFRRRQDRLIWGDSLVHPRHLRAVGTLLATARRTLGDGREPIEAWFSSRPTWWAEHLDHLGFVRHPQPQGLGFMALPDGEPEATEHLADLYYTMGDGDLF